MCGRAYETYTDEELAIQYLNGRPPNLDWMRLNFNMTPTQHSPVVVVRHGEPTVDRFRWGLVPVWAKSVKAAAKYSLINARGEEIMEKRSYAEAFQRRRCVVPLSGFYEWKRESKTKRPFAIHLRDNPIMSVAGVWERWQPDAEAEAVHSFSIVTTWANTFMADIHDRMPVILDGPDVEHWLDPEVQEPERMLPLLRPCPSEWLTAYEVSTAVNSSRDNSPDLLQRVSDQA
jgi:putative SOS response-associated peptidase YedK